MIFRRFFNSLLEKRIRNPKPYELKSNATIFADDISVFTSSKNKNESGNILNNDILLIFK